MYNLNINYVRFTDAQVSARIPNKFLKASQNQTKYCNETNDKTKYSNKTNDKKRLQTLFPFLKSLKKPFFRQVNGNNKMKGTLLEYMSCTFDVMDPMEFIQTKESSVGLRVILGSTRDPKVGGIHKVWR